MSRTVTRPTVNGSRFAEENQRANFRTSWLNGLRVSGVKSWASRNRPEQGSLFLADRDAIENTIAPVPTLFPTEIRRHIDTPWTKLGG